MDKFLGFCFKFGKIFTGILLVLLLCVMISSGIFAMTTLKKVDLNIPTFVEMNANIQAAKNNQTTVKDESVEPYIILINDISKKYLSEYGKASLTRAVNEVDYDYRIDYLHGFEQALQDSLVYAQNNKMSQAKTNDLLESIITNYDSYFARNIQRKEFQELQLKTERLMLLTTFASSILLFILCLIIPLLIRIEENTKK